MRDKILAAVTAAVQQLPADATARECEQAAADGIIAAMLAALPPEPTEPLTVVLVDGTLYQLNLSDPDQPMWWRLTSSSAPSRPYTWLDLWQLGTPVVLRPVPVAPRPAPYTGLTVWNWQLAGGGRVARVVPAHLGEVEISVGQSVGRLSPAAARQLAAVLLDLVDAGDKQAAADV